MLTTVKGDDKPLIQNFVKSFKNKYKKEDIFVIQNEEFTHADIRDLTRSDGLFSSKKLILIEPEKIDHIDLGVDFYKEVKENPDIDFIIILSNLNGNLKVVKEINKVANVKEFSKQRDYSSFNFIDNLFLYKDAGKVLNSIEEIDIENNFYSIIGLIHTTLRNYISFLYKNNTYEGIHPFVKKKLNSYKMSEEIVVSLYSKLLDIDAKSKTISISKKILITEFMIYFFQREKVKS